MNPCSASNYRYYSRPLDTSANSGDIDLGNVAPGDYYIAITQLNHLAVRTINTFHFDTDNTVTINLSDSNSPNFVAAYGYEPLFSESNGKLSLRGGDANANGFVNAAIDFVIWRNANGSVPGSPNWDIRADFNADQVVNSFKDFPIWRANNGQQASASIAPLEVAITSLLDGFATNQTTITVAGTLNVNVNNATVTVNGVSAAVVDKTFSAQVSLQEGQNTITAVVQGDGGGEASDSITGVCDTIAPNFTITFPQDGQVFGPEDFTGRKLKGSKLK